eukprot:scaffold1790_cov257-Pinguiococcus_pyrenoidosus.AAC.3
MEPASETKGLSRAHDDLHSFLADLEAEDQRFRDGLDRDFFSNGAALVPPSRGASDEEGAKQLRTRPKAKSVQHPASVPHPHPERDDGQRGFAGPGFAAARVLGRKGKVGATKGVSDTLGRDAYPTDAREEAPETCSCDAKSETCEAAGADALGGPSAVGRADEKELGPDANPEGGSDQAIDGSALLDEADYLLEQLSSSASKDVDAHEAFAVKEALSRMDDRCREVSRKRAEICKTVEDLRARCRAMEAGIASENT